MVSNLPVDLKEAEDCMFNSLCKGLDENESRRLCVNMKFEGLRIMPIAIRLLNRLINKGNNTFLIWADAGATALAKRESPDLKDKIISYSDFLNNRASVQEDNILIAAAPGHYDYENYKEVCDKHSGTIIMLNGKLEDTAVGIGQVGRERRKNFIKSWNIIYWIEPLTSGALMRIYPQDWSLYTLEANGYKFSRTFRQKPDNEAILEVLI